MPKLFNILVDVVMQEWIWQLWEDEGFEEHHLMTFFTIFYVNNAYLASQDAGLLQHALDILVNLFQRVGLKTNTSKTQMMICTPGQIRTQLPMESYQRM